MDKIVLLICALLVHISWATEFKACDDASRFNELNGSLCASIKAPQTYKNEDKNTIELFVRKFPSLKKRQGTVWLLAGGPGSSGADFYSDINTYRSLFSNMDVIVPDHRGTGYSSSICPEEDVSSLAGKNLVGAEWGSCFSHMYSNADYVKSFTITNAAKDVRYLINAMDQKGQTFIYGVSYGTQLALRVAQLENLSIDGIVLDSLVPMQDDPNYDLSVRSIVVNSVGEQLLSRCDMKGKCNGNNAQWIKNALLKVLKKSNNLNDFSDQLPKASLTNLLGDMLDIPRFRDQIPTIIEGLANNNPKPLEAAVTELKDLVVTFNPGYLNFSSSIPLVQIITASENNLRPNISKADIQKEESALLFTSVVPQLSAENSMPTYAKDEYFATLPKTLPKTMILHGTMDPKTHYLGAKKYAEALADKGNISFVNITDGVHWVARNAPTCFKQNVSLFLSDKLPKLSTCNDQNTAVNF